ncbi:MAG: TatD family hydrolase [Candidatus Accumulibacter sp.]|jgi:TatD DNase family protein|nr:TatD family hydrolase [Accumulibacter sp.]
MLIDTHCHLDAREFDPDRDAVITAARTGGIEKIIVPAVSAENFDAVHALCPRYPCVLPAYGIHPLYVDRAAESDLRILKETLRQLAGTPFRAVAVGEIGLDFYFSSSDAARQEYFFIEQLKIAREFDLPVLLHGRRAIDAVLKCLRRAGVTAGIAHAFNGSFRQAENFIRMGFCLGFGGAMTYPGSRRIRKLAASLPIENIVLESDAPDIPPVWLAGKRNSPAELPRFAEELAALRACPVEEIARRTTENALGLLRVDAA